MGGKQVVTTSVDMWPRKGREIEQGSWESICFVFIY